MSFTFWRNVFGIFGITITADQSPDTTIQYRKELSSSASFADAGQSKIVQNNHFGCRKTNVHFRAIFGHSNLAFSLAFKSQRTLFN